MRRTWIFGGLIALGLLAGGAALKANSTGADSMPGRGAPRGILGRFVEAHMGRMMTLRAELNLSDEQREAIRSTLMAHKPEIVGAVKPVIAARRTLREAVLAEKPDDSAIRAAADALGKSVGDAAITFAKIKVELAGKAKLTPEQMETIAEFRSGSDSSMDGFVKEAETAK
jgi:Spy/CpxP family protein refolding chaperone